MNIADIKELLADRRLINGERGYELDYELADSIDYLVSIIEEALNHSKGAPYDSSFENKDRLLEVRNILQGEG